MDNALIGSILAQALGTGVQLQGVRPVGGGCINETFRVECTEGLFFLKLQCHTADLFKKEAMGLEWLATQTPIRTPQVTGHGLVDRVHFLLLEFIEKDAPSAKFWSKFGRQLAEQHRRTNDQFGLHFDNHIGRLPQQNSRRADWPSFFIKCRLVPQLEMAKKLGRLSAGELDSFERLFPQLASLFPHEPPAALHGDLWSGNFLTDAEGQPCIFDPAVYFGHREAEIAFTRLFGGFDPAFYAAYEEAWPLQPDFDGRVELYNLYPLLVHVNLFGTSYLSGIQQTLRRFT